jgi:hypothetical protein
LKQIDKLCRFNRHSDGLPEGAKSMFQQDVEARGTGGVFSPPKKAETARH